MRRRTQPTTPARHAGPEPTATGYDWSRLGRHRLRAPIAVVIDVPVPIEPGARPWVATVWPDPHTAGGWARDLWDVDHERSGWALPGVLAAGDILEFGADTAAGPVRWYGIMDSFVEDSHMTVQGPYPGPAAAWTEAQRLLDIDRYRPPVSSEPPAVVVDDRHRRRARCRRHA